MREADELKELMLKKAPEVLRPRNLLSSGSTLLNIAATGRTGGAYPKGVFIRLVGDSSTRKTWIALTALAEATLSKEFADYRLVLVNAEHGALMNVTRYFGPALAGRLEVVEDCDSLEEFYDLLDDMLTKGPCVVILDSMDALESKEERKQIAKERKARGAQAEATGSYGTSKPKINSGRLKRAVNLLKKHGSLLIIISQTRDNIGFTARLQPKTYSGGKALRFYARLEVWLSLREKVKKKILERQKVIGHTIRFTFVKNHLSGWEGGSVDVTFYRQTGMDDVGSCIDWLVNEGHWKRRGGINAPEFDFTGTREQLVAKIQDGGLEKDLQRLVLQVWKEIEAKCAVKRKSRYHPQTEGEQT